MSEKIYSTILEKVGNTPLVRINKLNKGENVNADTLARICTALNCTFDEIMEVIPDDQSE